MTSIRQGIPHLYWSLTPKGNKTPHLSKSQINDLIVDNKIYLDSITEKTDGQNLMIGYDECGFFTRHSGSGLERARTGKDHVIRAQNRGNSIEAANAFSLFHNELSKNYELMCILKNTFSLIKEDVIVRGEMFNKHFSYPGKEDHEIRFVNTCYDSRLIGEVGMFVIHSKMSENQNYCMKTFRQVSNETIKIDHDIVIHDHSYIDVSDVYDTDDNETMKQIYHKIITTLNIKPKWGKETEGLVVHPSENNPSAPRFKIITDRFTKEKYNGR